MLPGLSMLFRVECGFELRLQGFKLRPRPGLNPTVDICTTPALYLVRAQPEGANTENPERYSRCRFQELGLYVNKH